MSCARNPHPIWWERLIMINDKDDEDETLCTSKSKYSSWNLVARAVIINFSASFLKYVRTDIPFLPSLSTGPWLSGPCILNMRSLLHTVIFVDSDAFRFATPQDEKVKLLLQWRQLLQKVWNYHEPSCSFRSDSLIYFIYAARKFRFCCLKIVM